MTNLRKAIFYLQQSIRIEHVNDKTLLEALDLLGEVEMAKHESSIKRNDDYDDYDSSPINTFGND